MTSPDELMLPLICCDCESQTKDTGIYICVYFFVADLLEKSVCDDLKANNEWLYISGVCWINIQGIMDKSSHRT